MRPDHGAAAGSAGAVYLPPFGGQHGLFPIVQPSANQGLAMREQHGVDMAGSGRINVAG